VIPRMNERSNPLTGMSPWTWLIASAMAGGLTLLAAPAQADVANSSTPTSQQSSARAVGPGSVHSVIGDGGFGGGFGGIGGFGHRRDRGDEITDLFAIFQED
jgi:hypothetical protein